MELDELKNIWQQEKPVTHYSEQQLATMMKGTSNSLVSKLKRSVWIELTFTIAAGLFFLIYAFMLPAGTFKWIPISILILFVGYAIYFIKKLIILNRFIKGENDLRTNLEQLVTSLTGYLKFYKTSYTVLYPVYFGLGILFGAMETGFANFAIKAKDPAWISLLLGVAISFFVLSLLIAKWLLRKLYGNHLEKLKSLLKELKTEEADAT